MQIKTAYISAADRERIAILLQDHSYNMPEGEQLSVRAGWHTMMLVSREHVPC